MKLSVSDAWAALFKVEAIKHSKEIVVSSKEPKQSSVKTGLKQEPKQTTGDGLNAPPLPQAHPAILIQRAKLDPRSLTPADVLRLQGAIGNGAVGRILAGAGLRHAIQRRKNHTGLPDRLKAGVENLSGISMDDVKVHYNSSAPRQVQALAYTQGTEIHVAPGQEKHLPHEAWHVAQQKQGRARPTAQIKGVAISDDQELEREADAMGERAVGGQASADLPADVQSNPSAAALPTAQAIQRKVGFEYEMGDIQTRAWSVWGRNWVRHKKGDVLVTRDGYNLTADLDPTGDSQLEVIIPEIDETDNNEVNNLIGNTVPAVEQDIAAIAQASYNQWTGADQIPNLGGSSWVRFRSLSNVANQILGQLQMTGGIDMNRLARFVSGRRADDYALANQGAAGLDEFQAATDAYTRANAQFWNQAQAVVNADNRVNTLAVPDIEVIISLVTLLATIPINARTGGNVHYPKAASGILMARTDFSKILMLTPDTVKAALSATVLTDLVLATINATINPNVAVIATDHIYPANVQFDPGVPQMAALTIGNWITNMMPTKGTFWGHWQGKDLLTRANFPGTKAQAANVESLGGLGSKVDPGDKPIFEFRRLGLVAADGLVTVIRHLVAYLR